MDSQTQFTIAAELIAGADALVIGAGAGMGVDSGLPDFRGQEGFWKAYPALAAAQLNFTEVASPRTFKNDPALAWGFYGHRLALYRATVPHEGFQILGAWAERMPLGAWIFTSNVDGQFQKAGFSENQIHECHGSIHHLQCMNACVSGVWNADGFVPKVDAASCHLANSPPKCPACGELARPNIAMFGDWSWDDRRTLLQRRREVAWLDTIASSGAKVVIVEIGAGTAIPSVRHFSHHVCKQYGARLIRINRRASQVPCSQDAEIPLGALDGLREIDMLVQATRASEPIESLQR